MGEIRKQREEVRRIDRERAEEVARLQGIIKEKQRQLYEYGLRDGAKVDSERRMREHAACVLIQRHARRRLALMKVDRGLRSRKLRKPDHIDRAIMQGKGCAKLQEMHHLK